MSFFLLLTPFQTMLWLFLLLLDAQFAKFFLHTFEIKCINLFINSFGWLLPSHSVCKMSRRKAVVQSGTKLRKIKCSSGGQAAQVRKLQRLAPCARHFSELLGHGWVQLVFAHAGQHPGARRTKDKNILLLTAWTGGPAHSHSSTQEEVSFLGR